MISLINSLVNNRNPYQIGIQKVLVLNARTLHTYTGVSGSHSAENAEAASKAYALGLNEVTIDDSGYIGTQISHVGTGPGAIRVIRRGSNSANITIAVPGGVIFNNAVNVPTIVHQSGINQTPKCGHCGSHGHSSNRHRCDNCHGYGHVSRDCANHKGTHYSGGYGGPGGPGGYGGSGGPGGYGGSGGPGGYGGPNGPSGYGGPNGPSGYGGPNGPSGYGGSSTVLSSGKLATFGMSHKSHGP